MSIENQIEVITYEEDRLNYFTELMKKAQKRYLRLFKKFKNAPYLSEESQMLSDAGREAHFHGDVVEMLEKSYRKQSEDIIPCKVGQTVYKICPKCNKDHNGSCERCAWRGCFMTGCDVGVRVFFDGSHGGYDLQIVPYKVTEHRFVTIIKFWNIMFFASTEEAETAKAEYDAIRKIEDRHERYEAYKVWATKREKHYAFLKGGASDGSQQ